MSKPASDTPTGPPDRYHGFSLRSVCWGYRDVFERTIEGLFRRSVLGAERREVTAKFFDLMKRADQSCFDHVLKEFLGAMNPHTRWLVDLPGVFADVVDLGRRLAESKVYYGIRYFECLGRGGFGDTPADVRNLLTHLRRLREVDDDLAVAFLKGYRGLIERMRPEEIELYVRAGRDVFARHRRNGLAFMAGELRSCESYIASITRECRLSDVSAALAALLKALTGREFGVDDLGRLDSDDLIERGSTVVCLYKWLYLPARIRRFDDSHRNRLWYVLAGVVAAGMHAEDSFPRVHAHAGYQTCRDVVGDEALRVNLFQIVEIVRVLRRIRARWPGARRLLDFGLRTEFGETPPSNAAEELLFDALMGGSADAARAFDAPAAGGESGSGRATSPPARTVIELADRSANFLDTAERLTEEWTSGVLGAWPGLDRCGLRTFDFLPDFLFPVRAGAPPGQRLIADLKSAAERSRGRRDRGAKGRTTRTVPADGDAEGGGDQDEQAANVEAGFLYDEWSHEENDYYRDHCVVHERRPPAAGAVRVPPDIAEEARRVSRVFERLKPDLARREKHLREGDTINCDLLLNYLVLRHKQPSPKVDFYERPRVSRRDLAVLILLDASGSTAEQTAGRAKVIDVEKHAAVILAQGLASLGDRFSVCAFSSNGRENCAYFIYKDFADPWDRASLARVLSAQPSSSTRIGPALRHCGFRLAGVDARQRLVIVVTDGKPMDTGYDPNTRYAQYDVRMACEENARRGIHTFGISTEANSAADMEIMFPARRYVILPDIRRLPRVLPKLYVRLSM